MMVAPDIRTDVHLIYILSVVITQQFVTRAAVRLNRTQSSVSMARRQLHEITNDKIPVRSNGSSVATPRAQQPLASSKRILAEFETTGA